MFLTKLKTFSKSEKNLRKSWDLTLLTVNSMTRFWKSLNVLKCKKLDACEPKGEAEFYTGQREEDYRAEINGGRDSHANCWTVDTPCHLHYSLCSITVQCKEAPRLFRMHPGVLGRLKEPIRKTQKINIKLGWTAEKHTKMYGNMIETLLYVVYFTLYKYFIKKKQWNSCNKPIIYISFALKFLIIKYFCKYNEYLASFL